MSLFGDLLSIKNYVYWVEGLVIIGLVVFVAYVAHSLKLFKKN